MAGTQDSCGFWVLSHMRQNGTSLNPFFYCVSYEILCETRIKPSFFWQLSHFPISGPGAQCLGSQLAGVAPLAIRALGSELPLVLIERIAHVRGGSGLPSPPPAGAPPQRGRRSLAPPLGPLVPVGRCPAADRGGSRDAGAVRRLRGHAAGFATQLPGSHLLGAPPAGKGAGNQRLQAVSLAFFPALRAYKVKGKVETFLKKSFIKKLYARFARHSAARTSHCIYTMRNSRLVELHHLAVAHADFRRRCRPAPRESRSSASWPR